MAPNGKMSMVKYNTYTFIEKIKKLLVAKFDGLQKHVRCSLKTIACCKVGCQNER